MSDEPKLPKEGVRGTAWYAEEDIDRFLTPGWYFDDRPERPTPNHIPAVLYSAEGSIVDEMANVLGWLAADFADVMAGHYLIGEAAQYPNSALRYERDMEPVRRARAILDRYREADDG